MALYYMPGLKLYSLPNIDMQLVKLFLIPINFFIRTIEEFTLGDHLCGKRKYIWVCVSKTT